MMPSRRAVTEATKMTSGAARCESRERVRRRGCGADDAHGSMVQFRPVYARRTLVSE
jgi:hypothetical protein